MSDNSAHFGSYGGVTATYGYRPNSDQIATTAITSSTGTELLTHSRTYEGPDRLKSVVASRNGAVIEGYTWGYDGARRRKMATISGGERSGDWWDYSYNNRGEVIGGVRRNAAGQVLPGYEFGYSFDAIGNRIESWREAAGPRSAYTANVLNQYESRTVPGEVRVEGQAEPGSALVRLQVDGEPAAPIAVGDGRLFSARAPVDNTTAPQYPELTIEAVKPGGGSATDWRQVQSGRQFVAQTPEVYTHDADGNLTSDGRWTYQWDAENRLIGIETQPAAVTAGVPKMRLEFAYDARHRRIRKVVKKDWDPVITQYGHQEERKFLYDEGWNLLIEKVSINQVPKESMKYLWGLDLSGTRQGAGGVGGLLAETRESYVNSVPKTYLPCYDGNGNIVRLVSADGSEDDTVYEYGPFGEVLRATGPVASANPFRWSTQYTDDETGLVMYAARPYNPATGRWLSRDPIEEYGGLNLYGFCANNPVDYFDLLGLEVVAAGKWGLTAEPSFERKYEGRKIVIVVAATDGAPSGLTVSSGQATKPSNAVDPKKLYASITLTFIAQTTRDWRQQFGPMPNGREPQILKTVTVTANPDTGQITASAVTPAGNWGSITSQSNNGQTRNGSGGSVGAWLEMSPSTLGPTAKDVAFTWFGISSWSLKGAVGHTANKGYTLNGRPATAADITDDGKMLSLGMKVKSQCSGAKP